MNWVELAQNTQILLTRFKNTELRYSEKYLIQLNNYQLIMNDICYAVH